MDLTAVPRNLFFTGKGGVGKTSLACASALSLAERGRRVLLISTDPASNIDEVLGTALSTQPTPVAGVAGLEALNIDPEAAAAEYRERVIGPYRDLLPASAVASMEEQLSGACTMEIAAFDIFAGLLGDPGATAGYDHVLFDTAPTGHTLRLLALPKAWSGYIASNTSGASCLGPLEGLARQQGIYTAAVATLGDAGQTLLVLVARPEASTLAEAARSSHELRELGIGNQHLVINGIFRASDTGDTVALAVQARGEQALDRLPAQLQRLPRSELPLRSRPPVGLDGLRALLTEEAGPVAGGDEGDGAALLARCQDWESLVEDLAGAGRGLIMTLGKGGVGKTTFAARIALALAQRGHKVHLTTTDPAAHIEAALGELPPTLSLGRVDPAVEVERYRQAVMAGAGAELDEDGRRLLEEDLRSPCSEEIAVFQAFADTVARARDELVVVDTAPTGHTLLLLDAAESYHREVTRTGRGSDAVRQLLPRLRDGDFSRLLICTLPEATPVHEAAALQADLRRAGIEPRGWIVNQALTPLTVSDPLLRLRRAREAVYLAEVLDKHAHRVTVVPWQAQ